MLGRRQRGRELERERERERERESERKTEIERENVHIRKQQGRINGFSRNCRWNMRNEPEIDAQDDFLVKASCQRLRRGAAINGRTRSASTGRYADGSSRRCRPGPGVAPRAPPGTSCGRPPRRSWSACPWTLSVERRSFHQQYFVSVGVQQQFMEQGAHSRKIVQSIQLYCFSSESWNSIPFFLVTLYFSIKREKNFSFYPSFNLERKMKLVEVMLACSHLSHSGFHYWACDSFSELRRRI